MLISSKNPIESLAILLEILFNRQNIALWYCITICLLEYQGGGLLNILWVLRMGILSKKGNTFQEFGIKIGYAFF